MLCTPPAFILSQDQTLCKLYIQAPTCLDIFLQSYFVLASKFYFVYEYFKVFNEIPFSHIKCLFRNFIVVQFSMTKCCFFRGCFACLNLTAYLLYTNFQSLSSVFSKVFSIFVIFHFFSHQRMFYMPFFVQSIHFVFILGQNQSIYFHKITFIKHFSFPKIITESKRQSLHRFLSCRLDKYRFQIKFRR